MEAKEFIEQRIASNNEKIENFNKKIVELQNENKALTALKKDAEKAQPKEE